MEPPKASFDCTVEPLDQEAALTIRSVSRECFEVVFDRHQLSIITASADETQQLRLDFSKSDRHRLIVTECRCAMPTIVLKSCENEAVTSHVELSVNLAHAVSASAVAPRKFQVMQTQLPHVVVLDMALSGCPLEDILAEVLSRLRMSVVIDRQSSNSRTCWLSGRILSSPVLIVLDVLRDDGTDLVSIDAWSDLDNTAEAILDVVADTRIGEIVYDFSNTEVSWILSSDVNRNASLTVTLSPRSQNKVQEGNEIVFMLDYQGRVSESFRTPVPKAHERLSVVVDLTGVQATWRGSLDDPYLTMHLTDAHWKKKSKSHVLNFDWEQVIVQQIGEKLKTGFRFSDLDEFSKQLNLQSGDNDAMAIFVEFCLRRDPSGCTAERVVGHCYRSSLLTGLVICFSPPRGLTGYLSMVTGSMSPPKLVDYGAARTWRDHLTKIVQMTSDFKPKPVAIQRPKQRGGKGRPPTQLEPTTHPWELFEQYVRDPNSIICRYCRFSE